GMEGFMRGDERAEFRPRAIAVLALTVQPLSELAAIVLRNSRCVEMFVVRDRGAQLQAPLRMFGDRRIPIEFASLFCSLLVDMKEPDAVVHRERLFFQHLCG